MFKILTILIVATTAATAYDFKDKYFNQYLFEDFQSVNTNLLSRQRRHTDDPAAAEQGDKGHQHCGGRFGDWKRDFTCCQATKADPNYFGSVKEAKKECAAKLRSNSSVVDGLDPFDCEQMQNIKELIYCENECVAKTLGHLDDEGISKRDVIQEHFRKIFPEAEESTYNNLDSYLDTCLSKIQDLDLKPEGKCNRTPMELHHCMFGQLILGCPAEEQTKTPHCDRVRESFSRGNKKSVGSHALHEFLHRHGKGRHGGHHGKE